MQDDDEEEYVNGRMSLSRIALALITAGYWALMCVKRII
jgi:hypothetical protein